MGNLMQEWLMFQKTTLDHSFQSMTQLQDYMTKQVMLCVEKNPVLPDEGKKLIVEWVETYRRGCEEFKSRVDDNYQKAEAFFGKKDA